MYYSAFFVTEISKCLQLTLTLDYDETPNQSEAKNKSHVRVGLLHLSDTKGMRSDKQSV